ncbi:hypothetical protein ACPOL_4737 [Acidisarcina polymorpha]|uniref:Uncharacterized protein n=1 Tax=Acidisarcina polymorpha TaxID=2211140 RepID=A0A2Z5G5V0_9BACT|nr:hypothetical protein ACPOL_4737 [Acidisarcina polymorpha]
MAAILGQPAHLIRNSHPTFHVFHALREQAVVSRAVLLVAFAGVLMVTRSIQRKLYAGGHNDPIG